MPGNKRVNSNLNIDGSIKLGTVPNLGTTATYILTQNPSTKEISQRTNSEIISDLNLASQSWVSTNYIPKTHPVYNVTQSNINSWNQAVTWGNHADAGYATQSWVTSQNYLTSSALTGYVPYTGATEDVNLGYYNLHASSVNTKSSDFYGEFDISIGQGVIISKIDNNGQSLPQSILLNDSLSIGSSFDVNRVATNVKSGRFFVSRNGVTTLSVEPNNLRSYNSSGKMGLSHYFEEGKGFRTALYSIDSNNNSRLATLFTNYLDKTAFEMNTPTNGAAFLLSSSTSSLGTFMHIYNGRLVVNNYGDWLFNDGYKLAVDGTQYNTSTIKSDGFIKHNSSNDYVLLGGGGHIALSSLPQQDLSNFIPKSHPVYDVTQFDIIDWNTAVAWGNHATQGYLKPEDLSEFASVLWVRNNYINKSHPVSNITQSNINSWNLLVQSYLNYQDIRQIRPNSLGTQNLRFGFTSWNNDGISPHADFIHFGGYHDSTGGSQNLLVINKSGFGIRQYQGPFQSSNLYSSYVDYWHTGNFNPDNYFNIVKGTIYNQNQLVPNGVQVASIANTGTNFDGDLSNTTFEGTFVTFNGNNNINRTLSFSLAVPTSSNHGLYYKSYYTSERTWTRVWDSKNFNPANYQTNLNGNYVTLDSLQTITGHKIFKAKTDSYSYSSIELQGNGSNVQPGIGFHQPGIAQTFLYMDNSAWLNLKSSSTGGAWNNLALGILKAVEVWSSTFKSDSYYGFYTSSNGAQSIKVGGLTVSDTYADNAPTKGIFSKGNIRTQGDLELIALGTDHRDIVWLNENGTEAFRIWDGNSPYNTLTFRKNLGAIESLLHSGNWKQITGYWKDNNVNNWLGADYVGGGLEKPNSVYFGAGKLKLQMLAAGNLGLSGLGSWFDVLWMSSYTGGDVKQSNALIFGKNSDYIGFNQQNYDATTWGTPIEILTTNRIGNSGNYATKNTLLNRYVVGELAWRNYGNGHTIFDASNSKAPDGTTVNNKDSQYPWGPNYPTLMGWNGANTYGVRVDSARVADSVVGLNISSLATQSWVTSQNYLTSASLSGYATQSWVASNYPNQTLSLGAETEGGQSISLSNGGSGTITNYFVSSRDGGRNVDNASVYPNANSRRVRFDFMNAGQGTGGTGNYMGVMTYSPWDGTTGSTGDSSYQLAFINETGINGSGLPGLALRKGIDTTWGGWVKIWHSGNFNPNSYSVAYSGNTLTLTRPDGSTSTTTINASGGGVSFSGQGDGSMALYSGGALKYNTSIYTSGTSLYAGAFYESSLRKYKENIQPLDKSGLDLVNSLNIVTFDRIDGPKNKIGIIADDSPEEFLSEELDAVDLYKTVFIQAKAIQELTKRLEEVEQKIK